MILSAKTLVEKYKSDIGNLGDPGDLGGTLATSTRFDRFIMILIVAFSVAISGVGIVGLYDFLLSEKFPMAILSLLLAVAGVYSALGVYREFVSMEMISKVLSDLPNESKVEVVEVLLDKDRNLTLIDRLLGMIEGLFSTKNKANNS